MDPTAEGTEPRRRPSHWTGTLPALLMHLPILLVGMLWTLPWAPVATAAQTQAPARATDPPSGVAVYRCRDAKGGIEFRDDPCPPGAEGEALVVEDHPTGWAPPPAPKRTETVHKAKAPTDAGQAKARASALSALERQDERCRKKREQVEDINRKLRAGAKVRKATALHHRREVAEEYLDSHCD